MMKTPLKLAYIILLVSCCQVAKGLPVTRPIVVEVSPADAEVTIRVENKKGEPDEAPTPARQVAVGGKVTFPEVRIPTDGRVVLAVSREEYAPVDGIAFTHAEARADRKAQQVIAIRLERLIEHVPVVIRSEQPDTRIELNGVNLPDGRGEMLFKRSRTNEAYSGSHTVVLSRERYREMRRTFDWNAIQAVQRDTEGRRVLTLGLEEIERVVPLRVRADLVDATVLIDGEVAGVTALPPGSAVGGPVVATLSANLVYRRSNAAEPYPSRLVRVEKLGFEYRPTAGDRRPHYETNLVVADAEALRGELFLRGFQPVEYVDSPVRNYEVVETRAGEWDLAVVQTNVLSALKPADQASPLPQLSRSRPGPMVVSKLAVVSASGDESGGDRILVSAPVWEQRADGTLEAVGANICSIQGATVTVHTKGAFDVDPCTDGEQLYFSSNRGGYRGIWKTGLGGKGGWTPVVQKDADFIDTEPAAVLVEGVLRLAFTRRNARAAANAVPRIMVKFPGNEQPSEMEPGHSPAWSPKGDLLAFISPDHKLWLMRHDGTEARQLTTGSSIEECPVWHPTGQFILFASNESLNSMGKHHYDLFQIAPDGSRKTQLTSDGSFDGSPAVAPNGRRVYFFSNRGAQPLKPESLQIYSMELAF